MYGGGRVRGKVAHLFSCVMRVQPCSFVSAFFLCCLAYCGLLFHFWLGSLFRLCTVGFSDAGFLFRGDEPALWFFDCVGGGGDGGWLRAGVTGSVATGEG